MHQTVVLKTISLENPCTKLFWKNNYPCSQHPLPNNHPPPNNPKWERPPPSQTKNPSLGVTPPQQKPPTQIFPTFSNAGRNVAKMATKYFFQIFSKFSSVSQNGNKRFFFQKFQALVRIPIFLFFQIFQNFQCLPKCCQNSNILPSAWKFWNT